MLALVLSASAARYTTLHLGVGLPDLVGGGASLTAFRPFELEVGAATGIIYTTIYARAGAAFPLYDGRAGGRGLLLEGLAMGGWRWLRNVYWSGGDARNGAELDLAAELSYWVTPHFALDAQLLAGGGLWFAMDGPFLDGRLSIGVAF